MKAYFVEMIHQSHLAKSIINEIKPLLYDIDLNRDNLSRKVMKIVKLLMEFYVIDQKSAPSMLLFVCLSIVASTKQVSIILILVIVIGLLASSKW